MKLNTLDHLVLTVKNITATVSFYQNMLGMQAEKFTPADGTVRWALKFGEQKINLHQAGQEFEPKARRATSGSADLCFLTETPLDKWQAHFAQNRVEIIDGPIQRTGAQGPILSIYLRDPDGNLLEISNHI